MSKSDGNTPGVPPSVNVGVKVSGAQPRGSTSGAPPARTRTPKVQPSTPPQKKARASRVVLSTAAVAPAGTTPSKATAQSGSHSGGIVLPLIILVMLLVILGLSRHWDYRLTATPKGTPQATKPEMQPTAVVQAPVQAATPAPVQVVQAPVQAAAPAPTPAPVIVEEKPVCYVNLIIVDGNSGTPQFTVFEGVPTSSIRQDPNGKMTRFTCNGKPHISFAQVIGSAPYTEGEAELIGTISCPDEYNPGKMKTVRSNQSFRDVYYDANVMYYKTKYGLPKRAPEQSTWNPEPYSPN